MINISIRSVPVPLWLNLKKSQLIPIHEKGGKKEMYRLHLCFI